jgi:hypothetical protein
MPTVVNDLIVEPQVTPPAEGGAAPGEDSQGTAPPGPELERQVRQIESQCRERALRLWAH